MKSQKKTALRHGVVSSSSGHPYNVERNSTVVSSITRLVPQNRIALAEALFVVGQAHDSGVDPAPHQIAELNDAQSRAEEEQGRICIMLGRCYVNGCDCHHLNDKGKMIKHFKSGEPADDLVERLRSLLASEPEAVLALILYDGGTIERLFLDGSCERI